MHRPKPPLLKGGASAPPRRGDTQAPPGYFLPNHSSLFTKKPSPFHIGLYFRKVPAVESLRQKSKIFASSLWQGSLWLHCRYRAGQGSNDSQKAAVGIDSGGTPPLWQGSLWGRIKKCPLQNVLQRAGFYLESRSLSSASSEPLARLKRPRSCSTVSLFFSSPATSTRILPSYIIIRRLP